MKKFNLACVLCLLFLFPSVVRCEEPPTRGLFVMALDEPQALSSRQEITKLVNLAKRIRVKRIFIQVYRGNQAWFASKIADSSAYEACLKNVGEPPLKCLIKQAHGLGIEVHAWLNMLSLSRNKNAPLLRKYGPGILTRNLEDKRNLEDYQIDRQYFLEPGDVRVRQELSGIIEELIGAYPELDGIQFDYVRYPDKNPAYGYTEINMQRFKQATGANAIEQESQAWKDWKAAQVTAALEEFAQRARRLRPGIQVSVTGCMPIQRALFEAFQDWPSWLNRKLINFVTVMDYSPEPSEFERWLGAVKDKVDDFRKVEIAIGAYKLGKSPARFREELRFSEKIGAGGWVIFHYSSLLENPGLVDILEGEIEYQELRKRIILEFKDKRPIRWAEVVPGVKTRIDTDKKIIALTLDACGSQGDGYDSALIDYLVANNIPATLFINARWIDKNPEIFKKLAANPLFEIENHGFEHKPCSVNGKSAYGISGTNDTGEVVDEIERNSRKIEELTGRKPEFYRSGTAYYDEVAVEIAEKLGVTVTGFSVLGDRGATFSKDEVSNALLSSSSGSIIICHMNHPEKETAEGLILAIPQLLKKGFRFVKLSDYNLK